MTRENIVKTIRYLISFAISTLLLLPLAFFTITYANRLFTQYSTAHLFILGTSIVIIGIAISFVAPAVKKLITKNVFTGSFDYDQKLKNLANEIEENPRIADRIVYCTDQLKKIIGVTEVEFAESPKSTRFNIEIPSSDHNNNWFVFSKKLNNDPWTKSDKRLLKWFSSSVSINLDLERGGKLEKRRLIQIKNKVAASSEDLKTLNQELIQREKDLALQFDELTHDLKNPIAVMMNTLNEPNLPTRKDNPYLKKIKSEVAWMNKSTGHLLDLARAEAGKITLVKQPLNLHELIQDNIDFLQDFAQQQKRSIEWSKLSQKATDTLISADEKLVNQLLNLLITRAIRLTQNCVSVNLTTDLTDSFAFVDLIIKPEKTLERKTQQELLDQFTHSWSHHNDRSYGITGLELSLAKWILKEHKGSLSITESDASRVVLRASFPIEIAQSK